MDLSEYLIEAVSHGRGRKDRYGGGRNAEEKIRKGIIDQLYVNVSDELGKCRNEYEIIRDLSRMVSGDCLWAEFVDEYTGDTVYFFSGKDKNVAQLVFSDGELYSGLLYKVDGTVVETINKKPSDVIKYVEKWVYDTPW